MAALACALALAVAPPVVSHPDLETTLEHLDGELRTRPANSDARVSRAWLMLDHDLADKAEADIGGLIADPARRPEGLHLQAHRLQMQGESAKALSSLQISLKEGGETPARLRLLSKIRLSLSDTNGSLAALRQAWNLGREEEDFLSLLGLLKTRGGLPEGFIAEGLKTYPGHPAAISALFTACTESRGAGMANGNRETLSAEPCLGISGTAYRTWWPGSADWRLKHATLLLAEGKSAEAKTLLIENLDLLDAEAGPQSGTVAARGFRKRIFALLDNHGSPPDAGLTSRNPKPRP